MKAPARIIASLLPFLPAVFLTICFFSATAPAQPPFRWAVQAGGAFDDFSRGIAVDASGNSYVTGSFHDVAVFGDIMLTSTGGYDIFCAKYDSKGKVLWGNQEGGQNFDDFGTAHRPRSGGNLFGTAGVS